MSELDIAALKAKLNQFTRTSNRDEVVWKPTEGKHLVRIVPLAENRTNPFVELHFHYLGGKTYISPLSFGKRDPIDEFADELAKEDWSQARPFRPKLRTYVPIIVRGEEHKGVRFFAFGKTVYTELLSIIADPDYGDITDITHGRDIVVEYIPQEKSDTNFAKTMVRPKPNVSLLSDSPEMVQKFLTEQPDIRSVWKQYSFDELRVVLEKYLDPENASSVSDDVEEPTPNSMSSIIANKSSEIKSATSVKDMVDEFDEIFQS